MTTLHSTSLSQLQAGRPVLWATSRTADGGAGPAFNGISSADVSSTADRLARFAPLLAWLFPELEASAGRIESDLIAVPRLQRALGLPTDAGVLMVKGDHALPVAGSIKARGGIHEVLEHAEALARRHDLLDAADYRSLAAPEARALFAAHKVAVGSTGNLGLAIGVMASALGFQAVVHMSADAKQWKKDRLRRRGVEVIEHAGDYEEAVAAGRTVAEADPACHFVDDEQSLSLLLGYAAGTPHLARQLADAGRTVGRRGDHAATRGVFLVHGQRVEVHPVHHLQRVAQCLFGVGGQRLQQGLGAALDFEAAGQHTVGGAAAFHAVLHDLPDAQQAGVDVGIAAPVLFVAPHDLRNAQAVLSRQHQQRIAAGKGQG